MRRFRDWWNDVEPIWKFNFFISAFAFIAGFVVSGLLSLQGALRTIALAVFGFLSAVIIGLVIWLLVRRK